MAYTKLRDLLQLATELQGSSIGLTIDEIAAKDVPAGKPFKIVEAADIPADRTFRDAWEYQA